MAHMHWWQEITFAIKWSKWHSFGRWNHIQIIVHSTSQQSTTWRSDWKFVRKEAGLTAQHRTLMRWEADYIPTCKSLQLPISQKFMVVQAFKGFVMAHFWPRVAARGIAWQLLACQKLISMNSSSMAGSWTIDISSKILCGFCGWFIAILSQYIYSQTV